MQLGIIADTHDNVAAAEAAVEVFSEHGIETVIHCGDFIAPPMLPIFEGFELHGVLGNNDGELDGLELFFDDLGNDSQLHGRYADVTFDDTRIFVLHGDQGKEIVEEYAADGEYEYVLYGHFHEAEHRTVDGTTVINPGGHFPTVPDEHRSIVTLDTATETVTFHDISDT
ncbi:MAG: YfcE family phosphodiesterase [Halobacteriales archaeon]|nr:YfcE family phosphodiesterase [Halobacteriales archaeon]